MFCSTVIPTIGRETLDRAVRSALDQELPGDSFEVIVVNDSGKPLPAAAWDRSERVTVIHTNSRERCVARNAGAAIARGRYLHFLDDDDWIVEDALQTLWDLSQTTNADWLYGVTQLVDGMGIEIIKLRHEMSGNCFAQLMAGEWIPLQASCIRADVFFDVGGFRPLVALGEDIDLGRRIAAHSDLAYTPEVVAVITRGAGLSTTDRAKGLVLARWGREQILDEPGVFNRMRRSARTSYYSGRLVRAYLTSAAWNMARHRGFTAASRMSMGLAGLVVAGSRVLSRDFWRAALRAHKSPTFARGFAEQLGHCATACSRTTNQQRLSPE